MHCARRVFVELFGLIVRHDHAFEPKAASIMKLPSVTCDVLGPLCSPEVVLVKVATQDPEKDVVINPFGNGTNATGSHNLGTCIAQATINATA